MKRPIFCANNVHHRIGRLRVEGGDGRKAVAIWTYYVARPPYRPLRYSRALCAVCIKGHDQAWQERYAKKEGVPAGTLSPLERYED